MTKPKITFGGVQAARVVGRNKLADENEVLLFFKENPATSDAFKEYLIACPAGEYQDYDDDRYMPYLKYEEGHGWQLRKCHGCWGYAIFSEPNCLVAMKI